MRKGIKGTAQYSMEHSEDDEQDSTIKAKKTKHGLQDKTMLMAGACDTTTTVHKNEGKSQEKNQKRKMNDDCDGAENDTSQKVGKKGQDKKIKPLISTLSADGDGHIGVSHHVHKKTKTALPNTEEKEKKERQEDNEDQETIIDDNREEEEDLNSDNESNDDDDNDGEGKENGKHDFKTKKMGCNHEAHAAYQPHDGGKNKKIMSNVHAKRDRVKATCTVSARMKQVVDQMISCSQEQYNVAIQQTTVFAFKSQQSEIITCFLEEMRRENAHLFQNKEAFLEFIANIYDHSQKLVMMHEKK
jgi:hypothetical protein